MTAVSSYKICSDGYVKRDWEGMKKRWKCRKRRIRNRMEGKMDHNGRIRNRMKGEKDQNGRIRNRTEVEKDQNGRIRNRMEG